MKIKNNLDWGLIIKKIFTIKNEKYYKIVTIFNHKFKINSKKTLIKYFTRCIEEQEKKIYQLKYIIDSCCDIKNCTNKNTELKNIQIVKLNGLKLAIKIFNKHNIQYWLDGGSCLGAYRHKGFIPWDDDIDIVIPRNDYQKAINILNEELKESNIRAIIGQKILNKCHTQHARIIDINTDFAYLDIFPYDYSNNEKLTKEELLKKLYELKQKIYTNSFLSKLYSGKHKIEDFIPQIINEYEKYEITTTNGKNCYIFRGIDSMSHQKKQTIHRIEDVFPLKQVLFEDILVNVPNNMENFLSNIMEGAYGNIMEFPPLEAMNFHSYKNEEEKKSYMKLLNYQNELICNLLKEDNIC